MSRDPEVNVEVYKTINAELTKANYKLRLDLREKAQECTSLNSDLQLAHSQIVQLRHTAISTLATVTNEINEMHSLLSACLGRVGSSLNDLVLRLQNPMEDSLSYPSLMQNASPSPGPSRSLNGSTPTQNSVNKVRPMIRTKYGLLQNLSIRLPRLDQASIPSQQAASQELENSEPTEEPSEDVELETEAIQLHEEEEQQPQPAPSRLYVPLRTGQLNYSEESSDGQETQEPRAVPEVVVQDVNQVLYDDLPPILEQTEENYTYAISSSDEETFEPSYLHRVSPSNKENSPCSSSMHPLVSSTPYRPLEKRPSRESQSQLQDVQVVVTRITDIQKFSESNNVRVSEAAEKESVMTEESVDVTEPTASSSKTSTKMGRPRGRKRKVEPVPVVSDRPKRQRAQASLKEPPLGKKLRRSK